MTSPTTPAAVTETQPLPPLADVIAYLTSTNPGTWWSGPTYRSPDGTQHCALSHVADRYGMDAMHMFEETYSTSYMIGAVNDGNHPRYQQSHPKDRCLAYLTAMVNGDEETTQQSMDRQYQDWAGRNPDQTDTDGPTGARPRP